MSGAKHFVVQFQNDVFQLVPGVAHSIIDDWDVDFLKQIGPRFTCTTKNTIFKVNRIFNQKLKIIFN